jgi:hypothetical protein
MARVSEAAPVVKLALYSAIFGDYEATAKQLPLDLDIPAVMFTDRSDLAAQAARVGWSVVFAPETYNRFEVDPGNGDPAITVPMLAHKYWKTHPDQAMGVWRTVDPGPLPDASIWVDGNMRITMPGPAWVAANVAALGDDEWSLMKHPWRDTVAAEHTYTAAVCSGRYSVEAMARLMEHLGRIGFPDNLGLFASGHMVRRHTAGVIDACEDWWRHNVTYTHQDQLSLPCVLWPWLETEMRWNANLPWGLWELMGHGA